MNNTWRVDQYQDETKRVCFVEILPEADLKRHLDSTRDCPCLPVFYFADGVPVIEHNSFDGRELYELSNRERGH